MPSRALTIGAAERVGDLLELVPGPQRPWPARMTVFFPPLSSAAALLSDSACGTTIGGVHASDVCPLMFAAESASSEVDFSCQSLQQLMCATPLAASAVAAGGVDQGVRVRRPHDLLVEDGDIREELEQVDLLLVAHAHQVVVGLPGDGQHRGAVHLGVVEAVQEVDRPGPEVAMQTPSRPENLA